MDSSRFLIVGAQGQLGKALHAKYPDAILVDRDELNIGDAEAVATFDWSKVDIILNAAAYTAVDKAESGEGRPLAWLVNASAVGNLARAATKHNLKLVHVSTDYVFDGSKDNHTETELFAPLGVYAQSKAAGDIAAATVPQHYILRTSWVIGDGPNFVRTMIGLAGRDISPSVVSDQIGRLTFTNTLVEAIAHLLATTATPGTYNVSNSGEPASWADITRAIFTEIGRDDLHVTDTTTAEYFAGKEGIAPRPLQSTLDLTKIIQAGVSLRDWREDLHEYIQAEQAATKEQ